MDKTLVSYAKDKILYLDPSPFRRKRRSSKVSEYIYFSEKAIYSADITFDESLPPASRLIGAVFRLLKDSGMSTEKITTVFIFSDSLSDLEGARDNLPDPSIHFTGYHVVDRI